MRRGGVNVEPVRLSRRRNGSEPPVEDGELVSQLSVNRYNLRFEPAHDGSRHVGVHTHRLLDKTVHHWSRVGGDDIRPEDLFADRLKGMARVGVNENSVVRNEDFGRLRVGNVDRV